MSFATVMLTALPSERRCGLLWMVPLPMVVVPHQTCAVHGAQAGSKQLCCAGSVAVDQTDDGQLHLALIVAAANDGAVSVLILGIGHSAFRGDQVDAADGIIQHAAAVIAQVEHKALAPLVVRDRMA